MHLSEILKTELATLRKRRGGAGLRIVETGTIRNTEERYRINDGWSTLTFAEHVADHGGQLVAIDLDVAAAFEVLQARGLLTDRVELVAGDSRDVLGELYSNPEDPRFDVAFLDSDNDADLILEEYAIVVDLVDSPGLIMVDDVDLDSTGVVKGHRIVPYLDVRGIPYRIVKRHGDGYATGVLIIEV